MTASTGELTRIDVAYPAAEPLRLHLRLGPCRLRVTPGDGPAWITGTYEDASRMLPLEVRTAGEVTIAQRFDPAQFVALVSLPRLDLTIARVRPFALTVEAGASENSFDLGGLPLTAVEIKAGAGKYELDFSVPNPSEMTTLEIGAGAGSFTARHLANANFARLHLGGGVSGCLLDFSGALRRDATARLDAALGAIDLEVPATTPLRVFAKAVAAAKSTAGAITRQGDEFFTPAALAGTRPLIAVDVTLAFGSLSIRAT